MLGLVHYFYFVLFKIRTQLYIWDENKICFSPTFIYLEGRKRKKEENKIYEKRISVIKRFGWGGGAEWQIG